MFDPGKDFIHSLDSFVRVRSSGGHLFSKSALGMKLTIELDRETDGRWIAEVRELNILLYGESKQDAIARAQAAALEIVHDRISHGEFMPRWFELLAYAPEALVERWVE